jgi:hypothetical protein
MTALPFPPVAPAFLSLFGCGPESVVWENPAQGIFGIVVPPPEARGEPRHFSLPEQTLPSPRPRTTVVEVDTDLQRPSIPDDMRCTDPPCCAHRLPAGRRTVVRKDSPNLGRAYYVCTQSGDARRCSFFRWADELDLYSVDRYPPPLTIDDVRQETAEVDPALQLDAWSGVQQGSERWHRLRACRITASNFGSVHRTNNYCSPTDLLRSLLWPQSYDSVAMRYGSVNEKLALWRFSTWLSEHADRPDLPIFIDEPGIWLSAQYPFLAGSPDGILYETVEVREIETGGGIYYRCRRSPAPPTRRARRRRR